jgi:hypothetical protein
VKGRDRRGEKEGERKKGRDKRRRDRGVSTNLIIQTHPTL